VYRLDGDEQEAVQTWSEGNLAGILYVTKSAGNCDEYTVHLRPRILCSCGGLVAAIAILEDACRLNVA
jgi:hypothetical protein